MEQPEAVFTTPSHLIHSDQTHILPEPLNEQGWAAPPPKTSLILGVCNSKKGGKRTKASIWLHSTSICTSNWCKKKKHSFFSASRKKRRSVCDHREYQWSVQVLLWVQISVRIHDAPFKEDGGADVVYISKATSNACHHHARRVRLLFSWERMSAVKKTY